MEDKNEAGLQSTSGDTHSTTANFANPNANTFDNGNQVVNRVAVKVPPFWPDHAEIWLAQVEAQFAVAGITSDTSKFNTVVAAIDSNVLVRY